MSNSIKNGQTIELSIPSGQSIAISTITGTVTADVTSGVSSGTNLLSNSTGGGTFGPYASGARVRLIAGADSIVDYDIGTAPANAYQIPAMIATDASGNAVGIVDPVGGQPIYFGNYAYTWATRPAAAGNTGQVIRVSDVGTGLGGSHWVSDGTYWRPVGGSVVIGAQSGSIATPVSSFTGVTSSQFTPIKQPVIPAGMLIPGQSSIEVEVACRRTGANATALLNVRLGTAKTSGDNTVYSFTYAATTLLDILATPSIFVAETGRITGTNWQSRGGSGNASVFNDRTGNINTAAEMGFTFDISSANASDSFALIGYKVRLVS